MYVCVLFTYFDYLFDHKESRKLWEEIYRSCVIQISYHALCSSSLTFSFKYTILVSKVVVQSSLWLWLYGVNC